MESSSTVAEIAQGSSADVNGFLLPPNTYSFRLLFLGKLVGTDLL